MSGFSAHDGAPLVGLLSSISADGKILLLLAGVCLIFLELNRPGKILPGASGLLCVLLSMAALAAAGVQPWAMALVLLAGVLLAANLWNQLPAALLGLATVLLVVGFRFLLLPATQGGASGQKVSLGVAVFSGGIIGGAASVLSRIAFRARRAKAVH